MLVVDVVVVVATTTFFPRDVLAAVGAVSRDAVVVNVVYLSNVFPLPNHTNTYIACGSYLRWPAHTTTAAAVATAPPPPP